MLSVRMFGVTQQLGEGFGGQIGSHGSTAGDEPGVQPWLGRNVTGW